MFGNGRKFYKKIKTLDLRVAKKVIKQMTATTTIITKKEYEQNLKNKVGSLCFPDDYWDATYYVNQYKLKKHFGLKGKIEVIITTNSHPDFKNIQNTR